VDGRNACWRLLDWARAFTGPGLLDLISWQGTTAAPDLDAFRMLLGVYIAAGGPAEVLADRGGLPVEQWSERQHLGDLVDRPRGPFAAHGIEAQPVLQGDPAVRR
jgi:hypothetical protein